MFGKLIMRLALIRLSQSLAIILNAGLGVTQALSLVRELMTNEYIRAEIEQSQRLIERGTTFTKALAKVDLFSPLELQILAAGEQNGELGASMSYIGFFHANEVEFDLKRLNDWLGPILIGIISVLILIVAMGIYLPIWNMINLVHS
jgi:MSHA biogenesis protein MshG